MVAIRNNPVGLLDDLYEEGELDEEYMERLADRTDNAREAINLVERALEGEFEQIEIDIDPEDYDRNELEELYRDKNPSTSVYGEVFRGNKGGA